MEGLINKPTVIITSGGRTGTYFFSQLFKNHFPDIYSVHEAENINLNMDSISSGIKNFGVYNSIIKKMFGQWGITNISHQRMSGAISIREAAGKIINQRKNYIENCGHKLFIESSYHYYGLIDVLPTAFSRQKTIYIIRDPRDWVVSHLNKQEFYTLRSWHTWLGTRISPKNIKDEKYIDKWRAMSNFEKLCWSWNYINSYAVQAIGRNPMARIYRFEDLFLGEDSQNNLLRLVEYITDFDNIGIPGNLEKVLQELSSTKINAPSAYSHSSWHDWPIDDIKTLDRICSPLMNKFNYGHEDLWQSRIRDNSR